MSWSDAFGLDFASSDDGSENPAYDRPLGLSSDDRKQPEVIVLDGDTPPRLQTRHDEVSCKDSVLHVFPDICPRYLTELALLHNHRSDAVISAILDKQERNEDYPRLPAPELPSRKRKRVGGTDELGAGPDYDSDEDGEECDPESVRSIKLQMATPEHASSMATPEYIVMARVLISQDFPRVPQLTIRHLLFENKMSVFETYTAMDGKLRSWNDADMPWKEKKSLSKIKQEFTPDRLTSLDMTPYKPGERAAVAEFIAARELRATKDAKIAAETEEENNLLRAQIDGQTSECGICFEECALNRMVRCEGETMHLFCRSCLRSQAASQIGMAKYELTCMSLEGCSAGFSRAQRTLFLDKKLTIALDRIEQEAVLRIAGIEDLETCPFCPYAAEYPPVEVDKEFRCDDPRCRKVSCRLCRKETHIPKTCSEAEADRGLDARHILEEAMSEALIRRCNKCRNPFVKQDGCNKIRCTKCGTLQCDVCRKTILDYSHFNDTRRGGKLGQCPLFDASEERYEKEVTGAEVEMRQKVVEKNPDLDEKALHIPTSKSIQQSEDRPKQGVPGPGPILGRVRARQAMVDRQRGMLRAHPGHNRQIELPNQHNLVGAGNNYILPPDRVMHGGALPGQGCLPIDRLDDWLQMAENLSQQARKHHIEPAAPLPMPAPRPRGLETFMNKMESLTKKKNPETSRPNEAAKRPSDIAQRTPGPAIPYPDFQRARIAIDPFQFPMEFPFHPLPPVQPVPPVPRPLNGGIVGNQGVPSESGLEMLPMNLNFDDYPKEPEDLFFSR
ncbi:hypothetical protein F5Y03DRAFT_392368 [Xylaria venustula]|nr:hypothetical protein F5Y03DRAFT_392368 [Xylaria venustula]